MITITYKATGKKHKLRIEGHAESVEEGKDLVCCAVSTLFYALAQSITEAHSMGMLTKEPVIFQENGNGTISCIANGRFQPNVSLMWWTIINGFMLLEENYPKNIKIKKKFS